jgi:hypothetical protein
MSDVICIKNGNFYDIFIAGCLKIGYIAEKDSPRFYCRENMTYGIGTLKRIMLHMKKISSGVNPIELESSLTFRFVSSRCFVYKDRIIVGAIDKYGSEFIKSFVTRYFSYCQLKQIINFMQDIESRKNNNWKKVGF